MIKAVFIDFYGTLVHGNGAVFHKICRKIYNTGTADTPARISAYWGNEFQSARAQSFGDIFELALRDTGFNPKEVVHIGSSLRRDICGADAAGIRALWLNRKGLHTPDDVLSLRQLSDAYDTVFFKESFLRLFL